MAKILNIDESAIFVDDKGVHLKIDRELLDFEPRLDDSVIIFRDENGKIAKVILGEEKKEVKKVNGIKSKTVRLVIAIYSVTFGVFASIGQFEGTVDVGALLFSVLILAAGICLLLIKSEPVLHGFSIGTFVLYCLGVLSGLYLFILAGEYITDPEVLSLVLLTLAIYSVPFALGIVYLVKYYKEKN